MSRETRLQRLENGQALQPCMSWRELVESEPEMTDRELEALNTELADWLSAGIAAIDAGEVWLEPGTFWRGHDYVPCLYPMEPHKGNMPIYTRGSVVDYLGKFVFAARTQMGKPPAFPADIVELRAWLVEQLEEVEHEPRNEVEVE